VDGVEQARALEVRKDPNSAGTQEDIEAQATLLHAVKADLEAGAEAVHTMEALRVQLETLLRFVEDEEVEASAKALEEKLTNLEMELVDLRQTSQGQDGVRFEAKLLSMLGYLTGGLSQADFRPTDQEVEVQRILHGRLQEQLAALEALLATDLAEFNSMLRARGLGIVGRGGS
jgi:hypothetical protein